MCIRDRNGTAEVLWWDEIAKRMTDVLIKVEAEAWLNEIAEKLKITEALGETEKVKPQEAPFDEFQPDEGWVKPSVGSDSAPSDSEYFYVDLDADAYESNNKRVPLYDINTTEEYGDAALRESPSNCEIEHIPVAGGEERRSTDTMICILDIPEWEYIVNDLHLVYNFPEGMCEYTTVALPWHFNYPIFQGPVVRACEDDPSTENVTEAGYRCSTEGISTCDGTCYEQEDDLCPGGDGDPICCYGGEREATGESWRPERECFGGPGLVASRFSEGNRFLLRHIQDSPDHGFRQTLSLKNLLSFSDRIPTSVLHSNYLENLDQSTDNLENLSRGDLPDFLKRSDSGFPYAPRLFFDFSCYDAAGERLHQIFLMIREWNTVEEFEAFYFASGNPDDGDPDVEGSEGRECEYEDRISVNEDYTNHCNDLLDFDDLSSCDTHLYPVLCQYVTQDNNLYPRFPYQEVDNSEDF